MRTAIVSLALACALATPALAQTADKTAPAAATGNRTDAVQISAKPKTEDAEAAAALVIAVRHAEDLERMAKLACAAGDTSKCPKPTSAPPAGSPSL